jgi:hypothetical protein
MRIPTAAYALCISVVVVLLGACGRSQPLMVAPSTALQSRESAIASHKHSGSWMSSGAAKDDLLYVTNTYDVTVYSYPRGKLVGELKSKDLFRPVGECSDKEGNIYILDFGAVLEYAHAGTKLLRSFSYEGTATACASDPTTGNLAVTYNESTYQAYVAVYTNDSNTPTVYQDDPVLFVGCGYDPSGNLYADGSSYGAPTGVLVELPKGADALKTVTPTQGLEWGGSVQWDGKYIAVGDSDSGNVYRLSISDYEAKIVGTVSLANSPLGAVYPWWIQGSKSSLVAPRARPRCFSGITRQAAVRRRRCRSKWMARLVRWSVSRRNRGVT